MATAPCVSHSLQQVLSNPQGNFRREKWWNCERLKIEEMMMSREGGFSSIILIQDINRRREWRWKRGNGSMQQEIKRFITIPSLSPFPFCFVKFDTFLMRKWCSQSSSHVIFCRIHIVNRSLIIKFLYDNEKKVYQWNTVFHVNREREH